MPLDYTATMHGPIYEALGVAIQGVLADDTVFELTGLDKTTGVEVMDSAVNVPTIRPACVVRMADLIALAISPEQLIDALLQINGQSWSVVSYFPKSTPAGMSDGELYIILTEAE